MAALRIILPAAAIALTLALFLQLAWPARGAIARRTSRRGGIGIAVLTAVYAVAAFTGLGSANAPQRFCTLEAGESATLALDGVHSIDTVWYYTGLYTGEYTLAYSDDGITYTAAGTMPEAPPVGIQTMVPWALLNSMMLMASRHASSAAPRSMSFRPSRRAL